MSKIKMDFQYDKPQAQERMLDYLRLVEEYLPKIAQSPITEVKAFTNSREQYPLKSLDGLFAAVDFEELNYVEFTVAGETLCVSMGDICNLLLRLDSCGVTFLDTVESVDYIRYLKMLKDEGAEAGAKFYKEILSIGGSVAGDACLIRLVEKQGSIQERVFAALSYILDVAGINKVDPGIAARALDEKHEFWPLSVIPSP